MNLNTTTSMYLGMNYFANTLAQYNISPLQPPLLIVRLLKLNIELHTLGLQ